MIYLDNAATTKISDEVLQEMMPFLTEQYGNAGTLYSLGRAAYNAINKARLRVAKFINADPSQIIFTSGGTEANNMVFFNETGYGGKCALVSEIEHDSVLNASKRYYDVVPIKVMPNGKIDIEMFARSMNEAFSIVSIMHTNNETGVTNPIAEIGEICKRYNVPFHTDCVQAAGYHKLDVKEFNCDYLTISSHKIHGPKGVGALYVKDPEKLIPLIKGGKTQEFGLRGGTENVAAIVGFGKACALATKRLEHNRNYTQLLSETFFTALHTALDERAIRRIFHVNGETQYNPRKTYSIRFDGVSNETLLVMLDARGVCVSAGSACTASEHKASHVLKAIGLTDEQAENSIRVSFSGMNTLEEVKDGAKIITDCAAFLHKN